MRYPAEMPLGFQIRVGKQKCGGHNPPPWLKQSSPANGISDMYINVEFKLLIFKDEIVIIDFERRSIQKNAYEIF